MLRLNEIPAVKICWLIAGNMERADKLRLKLKWGYTIDGHIFGKILDRQGRTLHEQYYLGRDVMVQIDRLHNDFCLALDSYSNARLLNILRKLNERDQLKQYPEKVAANF